jgi:hypothetical protein
MDKTTKNKEKKRLVSGCLTTGCFKGKKQPMLRLLGNRMFQRQKNNQTDQTNKQMKLTI